MAKLIIVHKDHNNEEMLLNADQITNAHSITTQRGTHITVKMANGDSFALTESFYDLILLAQPA
jgi:hypothetical protein